MDTIRSINFVYASQCLETRVQNIAADIDRFPTTPDRYTDLTHQLNESFQALQAIKDQAALILGSNESFKELEDQIISLYGRLTNDLFYHQAVQIRSDAQAIDNGIKCGKMTVEAVAQAVQELTLRLEMFQDVHRGSIQERQLISDAKDMLARAIAFLKGEPIENLQKPLVQGKIVLQDIDSITLGEIQELMDIAALVYGRDVRQAKIKYAQISEAYKTRFLEHMDYLQTTPFIDRYETIQALLSVVNELVNNGEGYPAFAEIDALFLELYQVCGEEEAKDKVFSWRARISRSK